VEFFKPDSNYNFVGRGKLYVALSIVLMGGSLAAVAFFGLNLGIDFAGGYELLASFPSKVTDTQVNEVLSSIDVGDARVQRYGAEGDNSFLILIREHGTVAESDKQALRAELEQLAGGAALSNWSIAESGENLRVGYAQPVSEEQVRGVLEKRGLRIKNITKGGRDDQADFAITLVSIADRIETGLRDKLGVAAEHDIITRAEFVGPQVGEQLRNQGILAVLYSLLFILIYVAVRFDFFFAPGAIVGVVHDVVVTLGIFAIFQLQFDLPAIAALLTLIGYSLNDTIVVYDRVRENLARMRGRDLRSLVNASINQTLSRTVLTGGSTILVIGSLLFFGGQSIRDFVIALFAGIIVGTYSSIAVAAPFYLWMRDRYGKGSHKSSDSVAAA
jgi:preprotein translocase subunit SecF